MAITQIHPHILDYLQEHSGCWYVSDLHNKNCYWSIRDFLRTCDMSLYPLEDWQYAWEYMLNTPCHINSLEDLRKAFIGNLV